MANIFREPLYVRVEPRQVSHTSVLPNLVVNVAAPLLVLPFRNEALQVAERKRHSHVLDFPNLVVRASFPTLTSPFFVARFDSDLRPKQLGYQTIPNLLINNGVVPDKIASGQCEANPAPSGRQQFNLPDTSAGSPNILIRPNVVIPDYLLLLSTQAFGPLHNKRNINSIDFQEFPLASRTFVPIGTSQTAEFTSPKLQYFYPDTSQSSPHVLLTTVVIKPFNQNTWFLPSDRRHSFEPHYQPTLARVNVIPPPTAFAYHNTNLYGVDLLVSGGTVSLVEFSRDGATWYNVGTVAGMFFLSPGDWLRAAFSVAPTITGIPR